MPPLLAPDAAALVPQPFRIRRVRRELPDTRTLDLEPAGGAASPPFHAGQFNMLYVFGVGEIPISISGDPGGAEVLTHTVRDVGAVSRAICGMKRGETIGVRGPFGSGWPLEAAEGRDIVLVAGGLGLAPLRPAVLQVIANRARYRRAVLLVGARTPDDLLFAREIERWRGRFDLDVGITVDSTGPAWKGEVGVVTTLIPRAVLDPASAVAFICGPEVMMRFTAEALRRRGVDSSRIHVSMERNMRCGVGVCGHCQFGPLFVCKDGPVFAYPRVEALLRIREV